MGTDNNSTNTGQHGHTLVELMIVVMIISILMAISLAIYGVYTTRAHVTEGLSMLGRHKLALAEYRATNRDWPANNAAAGLPSAESFQRNAVNSIRVLPGGRIEIDYNARGGNGTLVYQGEVHAGTVTWTCDGGTLKTLYRPRQCR